MQRREDPCEYGYIPLIPTYIKKCPTAGGAFLLGYLRSRSGLISPGQALRSAYRLLGESLGKCFYEYEQGHAFRL